MLLAELLRQGATGCRRAATPRRRSGRRRRPGSGGAFEAAVGGEVDRLHGEPVHVRGTVRSLHDGKWIEDRGPARRPAAERPGADRGDRPRRRQHARAELAPHPAVQPRANSRASASTRERRRSSWSRRRWRTRRLMPRSRARSSPWIHPGLTAINPARFTYTRIRRPMSPLTECRTSVNARSSSSPGQCPAKPDSYAADLFLGQGGRVFRRGTRHDQRPGRRPRAPSPGLSEHVAALNRDVVGNHMGRPRLSAG